MRIFGLTGGTGSGKSTVARLFQERGIPVVDADKVGHEVIAPGGAAEADVVNAFGEGILTSGKIDRTKLGALVFGAPDKLQQLNAIVHPRLFAEVGQRIQGHASAGAPAVIVDAALLAEKGEREPWLSDLILVSCPEPIRVERLHSYRGLPREEARRRMAAQTDPESKRLLARWVIDNAGVEAALTPQVEAILEDLRSDGS